jgi:hypothetical protein
VRAAKALRAAAEAPTDDAQPPVIGNGKERRLVAGHRYFGVEARALRAGLGVLLARTTGVSNAPMSPSVLCEIFRLDRENGDALMRALAAGGLVRVHGDARFTPSARVREYAQAIVVAPLSRARAKMLVDHYARARRAHQCRVDPRAVPHPARRRIGQLHDPPRQLSDCDCPWCCATVPTCASAASARSRIEATRCARSSRRSARRARSSWCASVADRHSIERPFTLVYHADDETTTELDAWERFRSFKASISRRLVGK